LFKYFTADQASKIQMKKANSEKLALIFKKEIFIIIHHPSSIIHHPSSIIHHPSPIIHHPSSIIHHPSSIT
jgi:hypothetical protein